MSKQLGGLRLRAETLRNNAMKRVEGMPAEAVLRIVTGSRGPIQRIAVQVLLPDLGGAPRMGHSSSPAGPAFAGEKVPTKAPPTMSAIARTDMAVSFPPPKMVTSAVEKSGVR